MECVETPPIFFVYLILLLSDAMSNEFKKIREINTCIPCFS